MIQITDDDPVQQGSEHTPAVYKSHALYTLCDPALPSLEARQRPGFGIVIQKLISDGKQMSGVRSGILYSVSGLRLKTDF
jgi:hypothetical protein